MNILDFSDKFKEIIDEQEFINAEFKLGAFNTKNKVQYININKDLYNRFYTFISSKYNELEKVQKIYYYKDMKLVSINDNTHICIRSLPCKYYDFLIKNNYGMRVILQNNRMINNINFPSLQKYDSIEVNNIKYFVIKYKNSEITLEFIERDDINSICLKSKIDKYNILNFVKNIQFILGKFYHRKIRLSSDSEISNLTDESSTDNNRRKRFHKKSRSVKNKHFKSKVNRNQYNSSNK